MHTLFVREHNRLAREIAEQHPECNGDQISSDPEVQQRLAAVYASVDDVDPWIGGLAEDDVPRAMVGPLFFAILQTQFEALRDGDRFWYQNALRRTSWTLSRVRGSLTLSAATPKSPTRSAPTSSVCQAAMGQQGRIPAVVGVRLGADPL